MLEMIVSGVVATVFLDVWQRILRAMTGLPTANWALTGRWFVNAFRGKFMHSPIAAAPAEPNELAIGWTGHYIVGAAYGFVYVPLMRHVLGIEPSLLNGLVFGIASTIVPWFFFMPAMGAGVLARNTPKPLVGCLQALGSHTAFGAGLAVGAMMV
ncbi:MAG: DUF2938 family protein [Alphaproteobacteria bacterium]|nr:DUF2938 family protein [Alphaproteobacteria bacterium]